MIHFTRSLLFNTNTNTNTEANTKAKPKAKLNASANLHPNPQSNLVFPPSLERHQNSKIHDVRIHPKIHDVTFAQQGIRQSIRQGRNNCSIDDSIEGVEILVLR